jgi:hypothetical protein
MRKYYDILDSIGGGDNKLPEPPKNYQPVSVEQRAQWNNFLDYANKQNIDFDKNPNAAANLMAQYKKANPNFSITPEQISNIQYEQYQLRKGDKFGSLSPEQLKYLRQGLPDTYINRPVPNPNGQFNAATAKLYYPQKGTFGTDVEGYVKSVGGQPNKIEVVSRTPASAPTTQPSINGIPQVYANHDTALKRAQQLAKMPGNEFLHKRADALIHANFVPNTDNQSFRDSSMQWATKHGIDPALFWASAAEEGATGLVPDKDGNVNTGDEKHVDLNGKYPVDGFTNFGLDHFDGDFKTMVKRGYLPKDFDYQKAPIKNPENGEVVPSANFKSVQDALQAKAAYIQMHRDDLQDWQKDNKITLSPTASQFFSFVSYNGGPVTAHKIINYYKSKGLLEGDKFLSAPPPPDSVDPGHSFRDKVLPRWKIAQVLKKERLF